jgi:pimeloyl-ACP methyl ester carboxylesterase
MSTAVLLHASASSGAQWRSLAAALSSRYRVEAPNLIGYGLVRRTPADAGRRGCAS